MYIVLATNSELQAVAFGPYKTEKKAEQNLRRIVVHFPKVQTITLELHNTTELKNETPPGS